MEDKKIKNQHYDAISLLESGNFKILEKVEQLKEFAMELRQENPDEELIKRIRNLEEQISAEVMKFNRLEEEILFPELDWVLPFPSSTDAFRSEHKQIIEYLEKIQEWFENKDNKHRTEVLQSLILNFYSLLERDIHKKNEILFYEAQTMLTQETLDSIYEKLRSKVK